MNKKVDIIKDVDGKNIVVINDLRFKGRRSVDWNVVEKKRASPLSNSCTVEKLISL